MAEPTQTSEPSAQADHSNGRPMRLRRAIARGTLGGVLVSAALATIVFGAIAAAAMADRRIQSWTTQREIEFPIASIVGFVLLCGAVSGTIIGVAAGLSRTPLRSRAKRLAPQTERPFSQRLGKFLGEAPSAEPIEPAPRSRMAFFSAIVPGRRYSPKPASYIRAILWRIRRLLGGGS